MRSGSKLADVPDVQLLCQECSRQRRFAKQAFVSIRSCSVCLAEQHVGPHVRGQFNRPATHSGRRRYGGTHRCGQSTSSRTSSGPARCKGAFGHISIAVQLRQRAAPELARAGGSAANARSRPACSIQRNADVALVRDRPCGCLQPAACGRSAARSRLLPAQACCCSEAACSSQLCIPTAAASRGELALAASGCR